MLKQTLPQCPLFFWLTCRRAPALGKTLVSVRNTEACLNPAQERLDNLQHHWEKLLQTDETKVEPFEKITERYSLHWKGTAYQCQSIIQTLIIKGGEHHDFGVLHCLRTWTTCFHCPSIQTLHCVTLKVVLPGTKKSQGVRGVLKSIKKW